MIVRPGPEAAAEAEAEAPLLPVLFVDAEPDAGDVGAGREEVGIPPDKFKLIKKPAHGPYPISLVMILAASEEHPRAVHVHVHQLSSAQLRPTERVWVEGDGDEEKGTQGDSRSLSQMASRSSPEARARRGNMTELISRISRPVRSVRLSSATVRSLSDANKAHGA